MAREADPGFAGGPDADGTMGDSIVGLEAIERFAELVAAVEQAKFSADLIEYGKAMAAAEREACAKVCDGKVEAEYATGKVDHNEMAWAQSCAIDIRARSINQ